VGQLSEDGGEGVSLLINFLHVLGVEVHFEHSGSINLDAGSLADDLGGEHEVLEDSIVDSGQGSASRASLFSLLSVEALTEDSSLGNEHDVFAREFLAEFADQTELDSLELEVLDVRHEDRNGFLLGAHIDLDGFEDLEISEIRLEVLGRGLEVQQVLSDFEVECRRVLVTLYDFSSLDLFRVV
jgi:hypothetical protein